MPQPPPDGIEDIHQAPPGLLKRHASPLSLLVLGSVLALGVSGLVGTHSHTVTASGAEVRLAVTMPKVARAGQFFVTRVRVETDRPIAEPVLTLSHTLWADMTVNAVVPAPEQEVSRDSSFEFSYGALGAGASFEAKYDLQINPNMHGVTRGTIQLRDGDRVLAEMPVRMRVLP